MGTLTHFRSLYLAAFENCRPRLAVKILQLYSVFCVLMLSLAIYALAYRAFTGFNF
mgnify:CR=1 FL=1